MIDKWKSLGLRIVGNDIRKIFDPRRLIYFAIFVLGLGNLGTFIPLCQYLRGVQGISGRDVAGNFATYLIAIAFTALADWTLRRDRDGTVSLVYLGMALASTVAGVWMLIDHSKGAMILCGLIGGTLALLLWVCVSVSNPEHDDTQPIAALGGSIRTQQ